VLLESSRRLAFWQIIVVAASCASPGVAWRARGRKADESAVIPAFESSAEVAAFTVQSPRGRKLLRK